MASDAEEIAAYAHIHDAKKIEVKRSARKSQLKKLHNKFKELLATPFEKLRREELVRKFRDLNRQLRSFGALQKRHEELTETSPGHAEDCKNGEAVMEEYQCLTEEMENCLDCLILYLADALSEMAGFPLSSSFVIKDRLSELQTRHSAFRKATRVHMDDPDLEGLRSRVHRSLYEVLCRASEESDRDKEFSPAASKVDAVEAKPSPPYSTRLALSFPKFSGKATDWLKFRALFTSVMESSGVGLPIPDRICHLLGRESWSRGWRIWRNWKQLTASQQSCTQYMLWP